ncbi:MAG: hypothetical protein AAF679_00515 [Pseudomonadota bacterium]
MLFRSMCLSLGLLMACSVQAQDASPLSVELNSATTEGGACRLTFVVTNNLPQGVDSLVLETVLFDASGSVSHITLFDFAALPQSKTRVRQFDVADATCDGIDRLLINGVSACTSGGTDMEGCSALLGWSSRTDIEVLG